MSGIFNPRKHKPKKSYTKDGGGGGGVGGVNPAPPLYFWHHSSID